MHHLDWADLASLLFGAAVFAILVGSYGLGLRVRRLLPVHHQTREGAEVIHVIIGMLVAMVAILLGLQLDAATKSFDSVQHLVDQYGIQMVQLDTLLHDYGSDTDAARAKLRNYAALAASYLENGDGGDHVAQGQLLRSLSLDVLQMTPADTKQAHIQADAEAAINSMFRIRWELIAGAGLAPNIPLFGVLLFWFGLIYVAFGLNGTFNIPVFAVLTLSALAVGGSIFVLADRAHPLAA